MTNKAMLLTTLCALGLSGSLFANGVAYSFSPTYYVGLGGSYNSVRLDESINARANMAVSFTGTLLAEGVTGGTANPFHSTQSSFAPTFQIGFLDCLNDSGNLWGIKFLYEYLGLITDNRHIDSFASSNLVTTLLGIDLFTGHIEIESSQTHLNHEFALLAYTAKSFMDNTVYLGIGPTLFVIQSNLYRANAYSTIDGVFLDSQSNANNLSHTKGLWGGILQLGLTHHIASHWLLDFCYSFAITTKQSHNLSASFENSPGGAFVDTGTIETHIRQRLISQGITCTLIFTWS